MNAKPNLTFAFSLKIIAFPEELESKRKFNVANPLFRIGTSLGANVKEAQGAESKVDFRHKCKIAYKEAEETDYCLSLCRHAESYPFEENRYNDLLSITKILGKIISSTH